MHTVANLRLSRRISWSPQASSHLLQPPTLPRAHLLYVEKHLLTIALYSRGLGEGTTACTERKVSSSVHMMGLMELLSNIMNGLIDENRGMECCLVSLFVNGL